ncbi:MAG TPA: hypothetical protein VMP01_08315 [Pirellulaceae bacterium]|nr:hypothetical protein [Pirellulaceae bacterium]
MTPDRSDTTIGELHRIRREMAERFHGDLFALTADAQARTQASGRKVIQRNAAVKRRGESGAAIHLPTTEVPLPPNTAGQNVGIN